MPCLVNGVPDSSLSVIDRAVQYGDGVFRTLRIRDGRVLQWQRHYKKLVHDCAVIGIVCPQSSLLSEEMYRLVEHQSSGVVKIMITRGTQLARGYAPAAVMTPTRIVSVSSAPTCPENFYTHGIRLRVCDIRLSHQPRLAGIKHLNRLENVLAAAEWDDSSIAEGVLLDQSDNVISGIRSNLFMVYNGKLYTPELTQCGVAGVQRERVIEWVIEQGTPCQIGQLTLAQLLKADEIFVVNSAIGLWPVRELQDRSWHTFPISMQAQKWLDHEED